ncbi:MAG: CoA-binding protein [Alphaproteobacteria bacterium]|nr:CoA-binding protein [Alphaproteobacteria bacterium]
MGISVVQRSKKTVPTDHADPLAMLFFARSIAVVGASRSDDSIGGRPIKYLLKYGYSGKIYPVAPKYDSISGLQCYASVRDIPGPVDLAILAVSAARIPGVIEDCAAKGVPTVVIFSSGFAELGEDGRQAQARLVQRAEQLGVRICGPNSMGTMNLRSGLTATFSAVLERTHRAGPIALVSQSGMYGAYILAQATALDLGLGLFATTGNEADIELSEVLEHVVRDSETRAVLAYVEQVRDGDAFVRAAETALEHDRPVVIIKVGRSDIGARTARSHTGAIVGSYDSYQAMFRQFGLISVDTIDDMLDIAKLLEFSIFPAGKRVGIISLSGGAAVMLADSCAASGLEVPTLSEEVQARLKRRVPFAGVANPIDATGQLFNDPEIFPEFLRALVDQEDTDVLVLFFGQMIGYVEGLGSIVVSESVKAARDSSKPFVMVAMPGDGRAAQMLKEGGIPHFTDPDRAIRAVAALANYRERREILLRRKQTGRKVALSAIPRAEVDTELGAKKFLAEHGIRVTREHLAQSPEEAVCHAETIGYPVVLKVNSPDIAHKTEVDAVRLDLHDASAVKRAFDEILRSVADRLPDAEVRGVLVQEMVSPGVELILGVKRDPVFGHMVLCGLGGIYAELLRDVALRRAPVDQETAAEMVRELRGYWLLEGARGREAADIDALIDTIVTLSNIAVGARDWIEELDINPLIALSRGRGCVVADALIQRISENGQ